MAKLNWDRVNIENLDALRKSQGFEMPGQPSDKVATSHNGQELNVRQPPSVTCPLCSQEIKSGELRRHKKAKHSHQSWPTKIVRRLRAKKIEKPQKPEQNDARHAAIRPVSTCQYCGATGQITKKHKKRCAKKVSKENTKYVKCETCGGLFSTSFAKIHKLLFCRIRK